MTCIFACPESTAYVRYIPASSGSRVAPGDSFDNEAVRSLAKPWYPIAVPEAVSTTASSGIGNVPATTFHSTSPFCRFDRFDILEPSRAEA